MSANALILALIATAFSAFALTLFWGWIWTSLAPDREAPTRTTPAKRPSSPPRRAIHGRDQPA